MNEPTLADVERAMTGPYATKAEIDHLNKVHRPPHPLLEPVEYEDGCVVTPLWSGTFDYYRPPEVEL